MILFLALPLTHNNLCFLYPWTKSVIHSLKRSSVLPGELVETHTVGLIFRVST